MPRCARRCEFDLCLVGCCQRRQPEIVSMYMAERNDHLHCERKQRQPRT